MSVDDQWGAEEIQRLRTAVMGQATEIDRLRAELAETRAAGDELAVATYAMTMQLRRHLSGEAGHLLVDAERATEGWRSVRGDAPTPGLALSERSVRRHQESVHGDAPTTTRHVRTDAGVLGVRPTTRGMHKALDELRAKAGDEGEIVARDRNERGYLWWTPTRVYGAKPERREIRSLPRNPSAAPADDTAAPDSPPTTVTVTLPVAEHDIDGEDEHGRWTQNPGWETHGIESGLISAWAQGVSIEAVLHEDGEVLDLEETAHKVLAAVAWHRHYERLAEAAGGSSPASTDGDTR